MPPDRFPIGADELVVSAFLVTDGNEAELEAWKQAHPDWFVAGSWTPPGHRAGPVPFAGRGPGTLPRVARPNALSGVAPLDPATISVADFLAVKAAAHQAAFPSTSAVQQMGDHGSRQDDGSDPNIRLVQAGPPRGSRPGRAASGTGGGTGPQTYAEEFRESRFNAAVDRIRRAEPGNRNATVMNHPGRRVPSEEEVRAMEAEADAAMLRHRSLPALPTERQRAGPEPVKPSGEILFPGGNRVGVRLGSSGSDTTTVTPTELERLAAELRAGAVPTPKSDYKGEWFTRADGVQFGFRFSPKNGVTIDVNGKSYATPFDTFRIHRFPWTE